MLSNQQLAAIELLADPSMTQKDVAAQIGVHQNSITNWKKNAEFQTELRKQVVRASRNGAPKVLAAMEREAMKGNAAAAKLYLQAVGYLDNREAAEVEQTKSRTLSTEEIQARLAKWRKETEDDGQSQGA